MEARHKVLIVDDDSAVLEVYSELLSQLPSRPEIFTTTSGAKALALLKSENFRLLICDLKMPRMDGLQVLSIVRRQFPELRSVVMTGAQNEEFRSRAYALGVDLFWLKPDTQQNMEMFLQCVESLLGRDGEGGFRGVQSKSLMDIIQMECLSQSSTLLRVRRGPLTGRIWINGGELIDAETEGATGEAAFRRILEWKSGSFENFPAEPNRERKITKPANALLLEAAQAMDETSGPASGHSQEEAVKAGHRKAAWRLAELSRAGADFVVSLPEDAEASPEAWGTDPTQELADWLRYATVACGELSQSLQAGPLESLEGRGLDQTFVLLPEGERTFLVGWPATAAPAKMSEQSKQLVASWGS
jgi:CheY-like chemotaxis protein